MSLVSGLPAAATRSLRRLPWLPPDALDSKIVLCSIVAVLQLDCCQTSKSGYPLPTVTMHPRTVDCPHPAVYTPASTNAATPELIAAAAGAVDVLPLLFSATAASAWQPT